MTVAEMLDQRTSYLLRLALNVDGSTQALFRFGVLGITISSRAGTAQAHAVPWGHPKYWRHAWGVWLFWILDHTWPFGKDKETGESHCIGAEKSDPIRAAKAMLECLGDPVVVEKHGLAPFRRELLAELNKRLGD